MSRQMRGAPALGKPALGKLYIVAAPSGAGKSSIVNACLARDLGIRLSVSFTSRAPRPGARHAEHYNFVRVEASERMVDAGDRPAMLRLENRVVERVRNGGSPD